MIRLRQLDLTLFGHFTDKSIVFGEVRESGCDFHIVHGPNEAGKTTVMEGYLRLLYGFAHHEPYAFKHQRANLRVGGALDINGLTHALVRLSRRGANLVDVRGDAVSEDLLTSQLASLSMEDYRKLLCLDDDTIESGGEEITRSKGDIGRLLFSAAAGIGDLSAVLDEVEARNREIYLKGGSRSEFAVLKREHDTIRRDIRDNDIGASAYRALRSTWEAANDAEAVLREQKSSIALARFRVDAVIKAHPLAMELKAVEASLDPIAHYPDALAIDPETLVKMGSKRVALISTRDRAERTLTELEEQKQALSPRPEVLKQAEPLEVLRFLKSRVETARFDLPKREEQLGFELEALRSRLSDLGIDATEKPTRFVLGEPQLVALERSRDSVRSAERDLETAKAESLDAADKQAAASRALETARAAATIGPELGALMARYNADAVLEKYKASQHDEVMNKRHLAARLQSLTCLGQSFEDVPDITLTVPQAEALASEIGAANQICVGADDSVRTATQKWNKAQFALDASRTIPGLIDDGAAADARQRRDALWAEHRHALDPDTADRFHAAMRGDDEIRNAREGQIKEIAEHRQAVRAELEARHDLDVAKIARDDALDRRRTAQETLVLHLERCGLDSTLSADEFARWVRDVEEARKARDSHDALIAEHAPQVRAADMLREALAANLGEPDATLEALVAIARARIDDFAEEQQVIKDAKVDLAREKDNAKRRDAKLREAQHVLSDARQEWAALIAQHLPDATLDIDLLDALPTFRALREINERVTSIQRQIDGMTQDLVHFEAGIRKIAPETAAGQDPIEAFAAVAAEVAAERQVQETLADLTARIDAAVAERDSCRADLEILDEQVRDLAAGFDPRIPTDSLEHLRDAVKTADLAIALRERAKTVLQEILSTLGVETRTRAEAELAELSVEQATARRQEIDSEITRTEQALDKAIEDRTEARVALDQVNGDGDIAALGARKRTIEAEMEAVLLKYLEGQFGHRLADRAIRRYRDTHRSGMLAATEKAFSELTNGAYSALTVRPGSGTETLMAIQASDQTAKEASAMSKGTRFQLFLALRAAAYEQMAENGTILPFFCDDVFETFDEMRTRAACALMRRIGRTGQAIYLTHHQHVVDIAREVCGDDVTIHTL